MVSTKRASLMKNYFILVVAVITIVLKILGFWDEIDVYVHNNLPTTHAIYLQVFTETASVFISLITLVLIMFFLSYRKRKVDINSVLELLIGFAVTNLIIVLLKLAFGLPRPSKITASLIPSIISSIDVYSFPSGHAGRAGYLAGLIERVTNRSILKIIGVTYAILICMSRLLLGYHWLSDVIAGVLIGYYVGLTFYLPKKLINRFTAVFKGTKRTI